MINPAAWLKDEGPKPLPAVLDLDLVGSWWFFLKRRPMRRQRLRKGEKGISANAHNIYNKLGSSQWFKLFTRTHCSITYLEDLRVIEPLGVHFVNMLFVFSSAISQWFEDPWWLCNNPVHNFSWKALSICANPVWVQWSGHDVVNSTALILSVLWVVDLHFVFWIKDVVAGIQVCRTSVKGFVRNYLESPNFDCWSYDTYVQTCVWGVFRQAIYLFMMRVLFVVFPWRCWKGPNLTRVSLVC